ncbi:MAG: hypothetical protein V4631_22950 [Pseudomonadota bacterium]
MPKLFVVLLLSLATLASAAESGVTATVSLAGPDTLNIRYELPDNCQVLPFINKGIRDEAAAGIRSDWKASDACGAVDGHAVRRTAAACKALAFSVPATTRGYDRVYPWAFPMGGAVYSHTGAFAVDGSCGPVSWKIVAPGGTVVLNGEQFSENAALSPYRDNATYMPVVFLNRPISSSRSYIDPRLPAATAEFVADAIRRAFAQYPEIVPGLHAAYGFVVVTPSPHQGWRGDAGNGTTLRLMVPATIAPEMELTMRAFIAHEVAHFFQPLVWRDAWSGEQNMLAEGGAELLHLMALERLKWADRGALKLILEGAVNKCVLAMDNLSWSENKDRGWGKVPYHCGLTFHALGLASRSTATPAATLMRDYYLAGRKGEVTDFAAALECGGKTGCRARWLNRIAGKEPVAAVLSAYATSGGFLKPASGVAPAMVEPVMRKLMARLMGIDCGGSVSIHQDPGAARIGQVKACKVLREGMVIVTVQGQPLFAGDAGIEALLAACHGKGLVTLGLKEGAPLELSCSATAIGTVPEMFEVDMDVVRTLLGAGQPLLPAVRRPRRQ